MSQLFDGQFVSEVSSTAPETVVPTAQALRINNTLDNDLSKSIQKLRDSVDEFYGEDDVLDDDDIDLNFVPTSSASEDDFDEFFGEIEIKAESEDDGDPFFPESTVDNYPNGRVPKPSSVSTTYFDLCRVITTNAPKLHKFLSANVHRLADLVCGALYDSVRLEEWKLDEPTNSFLIQTRDEMWYVRVSPAVYNDDIQNVSCQPVTEASVNVCRGLSSYPVMGGAPAQHLFQLLHNAREAVKIAFEQERSKGNDWDESEDDVFNGNTLGVQIYISEAETPVINSVKELKTALEAFEADEVHLYEIPILNILQASRPLKEWKKLPYENSYILWMEEEGWVIRLTSILNNNKVMLYRTSEDYGSLRGETISEGSNAQRLFNHFAGYVGDENETEESLGLDMLSEAADDAMAEPVDQSSPVVDLMEALHSPPPMTKMADYFDPDFAAKQEAATPTPEIEMTNEKTPEYLTGASVVSTPMNPDAVPAATRTKTAAAITNLKSVEGRVLTLMEVAFPDATQRDAMKSLVKKEFRREMNKVNRTPDEDEE